MNDSKYLVSVGCTTFNHASFITNAMNGFCAQTTNFPFVSIIVDDASIDGEQEVIQMYLQANFNLDDVSLVRREETDDYKLIFAQHKVNKNCHFAVLFLKYNHYSIKKDKNPYYAEWWNSTKYIAICEGDDYWTDPCKLQKQVDYLENHPDCVMCVHGAEWIVGENEDRVIMGCNYHEERDLTTDEIIVNGGLYVAWASTMFKTGFFPDGKERPLWWQMADVGDYPRRIYASLIGKVHFLPDLMCVYRYQHPGSWTYKDKQVNYDHLLCEVNWMNLLDTETQHKYQHSIYKHLFPRFYRALYRGNKISTKEYVKAYLAAGKPISHYRLFKDIVRYFVKKIRICKNS